MIIEGLLTLFQGLLHLLFDGISIPSLPAAAHNALTAVSRYISQGLGIFAAFTHWDYIKTLFVAALAVEGVMLGYKFIVWLLKKIPMAGVS